MQQHDVRLECLNLIKSVFTVISNTDDLHILLSIDQYLYATSKQLLLIYNQHFNHPLPSLPSYTLFSMFVVEVRKSTRLNSSHVSISYAVLCLKKKQTTFTPHNWRYFI